MLRTNFSIGALLLSVLAVGCATPDKQVDDESTDTTGGTDDGSTEPTGGTGGVSTEPTGGTGEDEAPVPFDPGSRLIPRAAASAEDPVHVAQLFGWYDQVLDLDCSFANTVEGDIRCVPIDTQVIRGFTSPDCAPGTEIAVIPSQGFDCDQGLVVYSRNAPDADESCGEWLPEYGVIELGEKLPKTQFFYGSGQVCLAHEEPSPDWTANYCQYTEASLADFVRADILEEPVGAIERHTYVGEDGSRQVWRGYDPGIASGVFPDRGRLLPSVGGSLAAFADPGCTVPAACGVQCGEVTLFWDEGLCVADVARLGATQVDGYAGDTCTALQQGDLACYEVVEIRPPLIYANEQVGVGRLQLTWARHADTSLMPIGLLYDTELATPCYATELSPGQFQCESLAGPLPSVFSDPECLVRIGAEASDGGCSPPPGAVRGPDGEPLRVNPLPVFDGPTYTRNGQPDDGPAFNCSERLDPTALYELIPAEVGWAPLVTLAP